MFSHFFLSGDYSYLKVLYELVRNSVICSNLSAISNPDPLKMVRKKVRLGVQSLSFSGGFVLSYDIKSC